MKRRCCEIASEGGGGKLMIKRPITEWSMKVRRLGRSVVRIDGFTQVAHSWLFRQVTVCVETCYVFGRKRAWFAVIPQDQSWTQRPSRWYLQIPIQCYHNIWKIKSLETVDLSIVWQDLPIHHPISQFNGDGKYKKKKYHKWLTTPNNTEWMIEWIR